MSAQNRPNQVVKGEKCKQQRKSMICCWKSGKINFEKKNFKGGTLWCWNGRNFFFPFFKISNFFFEKWLQWDVADVERNKVMKFELILSIRGEITRDQLPGGVRWPPPPCRIGLRPTEPLWKALITFVDISDAQEHGCSKTKSKVSKYPKFHSIYYIKRVYPILADTTCF